ncbi:PPR containing plant-like protein, partial [Medicago truncatula]
LGIEIDACCLNIMIKGLYKKGELEGAFKVFDEFPKMDLKRNERTFATLMHGLCDKGMVDDGFGLLERMKEEGIVVDVVVYNVLIHGLVKNERVDEGIRVLEDVGVILMSSYQHV